MIKTKLIKLTDKFILVSDEAININEFYLQDNSIVKCIEENVGLTNMCYLKVIAGIPELPSIDLSLLSEEDCKKIGWIDVEKYFFDKFGNVDPSLGKSDYRMGYESGFKAAQSLNKEFSLEDIQKVYVLGQFQDTRTIEEVIQSLQQTIWDVKVEMECGEARQCECISNINCLKPQSKITNNSIKITKIL